MFRISVFALVVLELCVCSAARADDAEKKAIAFVEKLGGIVKRNEKAPGKPVTEVSLLSSKMTDVGLKELAPLKYLTTLNLSHTKVTNVGLKEMATLKNLSSLNLSGTQVTDVGLKELAPLNNLTTLNLSHSKVMGLKELTPLMTSRRSI